MSFFQRYDGKEVGRSEPKWVCYFYFVGWLEFSLGIHVSLDAPNIEIHVPFGFFKLGRVWKHSYQSYPREDWDVLVTQFRKAATDAGFTDDQARFIRDAIIMLNDSKS